MPAHQCDPGHGCYISSRIQEYGLPYSSLVKNLPAIQEIWVRALGQEDRMEKAMAIHCSILAWRIQWIEEPGGPQSMGSQKVGHD